MRDLETLEGKFIVYISLNVDCNIINILFHYNQLEEQQKIHTELVCSNDIENLQ